MTVEIVSVVCGGDGPVLPEPDNAVTLFINRENRFTPCHVYQALVQQTNSDVICYIHDDVEIYDPNWMKRVMDLFKRPEVAVVGLGGATRLGHPDLYKRPYALQRMARYNYVSNQRDWHIHGGHETGDKQVAVVDAFFIAVRTKFLRRIGGWPVEHLSHHCLDLWVCCEAAREGREVWMCGVDVLHKGGGTSVKPVYRDAKWLQGGTLESDHQAPHKWLHDEYRDVLPIEVK